MLALFNVQLFGSLAIHKSCMIRDVVRMKTWSQHFVIPQHIRECRPFLLFNIDQVKDKTCCLNSHYITMSKNMIQS